MAIKVLSKKKNLDTRVVTGSVCVFLPVLLQEITGSMLLATWDFNGAL